MSALEKLLLEKGVLSTEQLEKVRSVASTRGMALEKAILSLGIADEVPVYRQVSTAYGLPYADPSKAKPEALERIPKEQIEQNSALPVLIKDGVLYVAIDDPINTFVADNLSFIAGCDVKCAIAPPNALKEAIRRVVGGGEQLLLRPASTQVLKMRMHRSFGWFTGPSTRLWTPAQVTSTSSLSKAVSGSGSVSTGC